MIVSNGVIHQRVLDGIAKLFEEEQQQN
jgi:hypothetical protein